MVEKNLLNVVQKLRKRLMGTSMVVQWLTLHTSTSEGSSSILGQGIKIPQAISHKPGIRAKTNKLALLLCARKEVSLANRGKKENKIDGIDCVKILNFFIKNSIELKDES